MSCLCSPGSSSAQGILDVIGLAPSSAADASAVVGDDAAADAGSEATVLSTGCMIAGFGIETTRYPEKEVPPPYYVPMEQARLLAWQTHTAHTIARWGWDA